MSPLSFALIVPTKDRPEDLKKLLRSIQGQTRRPEHIIIVDGSDHPVHDLVNGFKDLEIQYIPVRPPSLPKQRNVGLKNVPSNIKWIGFLDDDLVLENSTLASLEDFLKGCPSSVQGCGLSIINQPSAKGKFFNRFFLLDDGPGKITSSGFPSEIPFSPENSIQVDWLYGGATFWSKAVIETTHFDEWFKGTGYMEDVDFSYRVSREHELMICSSAKCHHFHHPIKEEKFQSIGKWQLTSWWYFVQKHGSFSLIAFLWSATGILLRNTLAMLITGFSRSYRLKVRGNLQGLLSIFTGAYIKEKGFQK